jgi:hypothetical protein
MFCMCVNLGLYIMCVGFEILSAETVNSTIFRVVKQCSSERVRLFGGRNRLRLQGRKAKQVGNQK